MAAKKNPLEELTKIADHYDRIRSTNPNLTEQRILEIVAQSTGVTVSVVKKRWTLIQGIDWPIIDYLERGVIGMNRANALVEKKLELTLDEATQVMNKSLDDNITDLNFKEYLARWLDKRAAAAAEAAENA